MKMRLGELRRIIHESLGVPDLMFHPQIDEGEVIAFGPVRVTGIYFLPRER